jgi:hypothetical protein
VTLTTFARSNGRVRRTSRQLGQNAPLTNANQRERRTHDACEPRFDRLRDSIHHNQRAPAANSTPARS